MGFGDDEQTVGMTGQVEPHVRRESHLLVDNTPPPASADTHISTLFFTGNRVFKLLKPVANGFLDHTDTTTRCAAATREYELNARLAPDVYLGTADVIEHGQLADRMIVMQRLPADRSVSKLLRAGALTEDHVRSIARAVAVFHAALPAEHPSEDAVDAHRRRWTDNANELASFVGPVLRETDAMRVTELFHSWLDSHGALLNQRIEDGYLRDGHGDLLADDIFCLEDGPKILDCLAFRDDLRLVDVLDDIAFLAMDLHRLAGPSWAQMLLRYYAEFSGEHHPGSLAHYYLAYRAQVRCKIACLRVAEGELQFAAVARMYLRLCLDQLERARLRLILVGGGPGTGKTTLARALGQQFGCAVLSSDEIRKDLFRVDRTAHNPTEPDTGIYSPDSTERTYDEMLREAGLLLRSGETAILDASWIDEHQREKARSLAGEYGAELIPLECRLPAGIAKERVSRRLADLGDTSDATPQIVDHLHSIHDEWPDAIPIDTNQNHRLVEADALAAVRAFGRNSHETNTSANESFWGSLETAELVPTPQPGSRSTPDRTIS